MLQLERNIAKVVQCHMLMILECGILVHKLETELSYTVKL